MAIQRRGKWVCGYCGREYVDQSKADICRDSHELIYVPFNIKDLNMLVHFVMTGDKVYLNETIVSTLQHYVRGNLSD